MAMFTEKGQGVPEAEAGLSIIGTGMRVVGDITAYGVVKIEGTVVGTVRAGRQVLVGKGGEVEGDVISREAIIGGEVRGSIRADERIEIQSTSVVHGDVVAKRLLVAFRQHFDEGWCTYPYHMAFTLLSLDGTTLFCDDPHTLTLPIEGTLNVSCERVNLG